MEMIDMPFSAPASEKEPQGDALGRDKFITTVNGFFEKNRKELVDIARRYLGKTGLAYDPRADADDVVHDTYQKILNHANSKEFVPYIIESPYSFVFTVMRNIMIDHIRKQRREVPTPMGVHGDVHPEGAENELLYGSVSQTPEEALMMPPDKELSAFLFEDGEFEGMKYDPGKKTEKNKDIDLLILKCYAHGESGAQTAERLIHLGYIDYDMDDEQGRKKAVNIVQQRLSRVLEDIRSQLGIGRKENRATPDISRKMN